MAQRNESNLMQGFNPSDMMDPETFKNFIMFQNFMKMQSMMANQNVGMMNSFPINTGINQQQPQPVILNKDENNDNLSVKSNNDNKQIPLKNRDELSVRTQNNFEQIQNENILNKKIIENKQSENNVLTENQNKSVFEKELNLSNHEKLQNSNHHSSNHNFSVEETHEKKEIEQNKNRFDDIPIKGGNTNFLELLEKNLNNEQYNGENIERKKVVKRERFKKEIKISNPADDKKYKYYIQNFQKDFGDNLKEDELKLKELEFEAKEREKQKDKKKKYQSNTKSKSVQKIQVKKEEKKPAPKDISKNKDMNTKSNLNLIGNQTVKDEKNTKKGKPPQTAVKQENTYENYKNLWDVEEKGDYDEFLDYEKASKKMGNNIQFNTKNGATNINNNPMKLKDNLNFNHPENNLETKFTAGFNITKEDKIEIKQVSVINEKGKVLNQVINKNNNLPIKKNNDIFSEKYLQDKDFEIADLKKNVDDSDEHEDNEKQRLEEILQKNKFVTNKISNEEKNLKPIKINEMPIRQDIEMEKKFKYEAKNYDEEVFNEKENDEDEEEDDNNQREIQEFIGAKQTNSKKIETNYMPVTEDKTKITNESPQIKLSALANEKLNELNNEIQQCKRENENVLRIKTQYENLLKKVQKEYSDFQEKKEKEMKEFELYKEEEKNKIIKERKNFERSLKQLQAQQSAPNKKEREEIETLKATITKMVEEGKKRDNTNKFAIERLKKQLEEAQNKVEGLTKDLKILEEQRLKNWDNNQKKMVKTNAGKSSSLIGNNEFINNSLQANNQTKQNNYSTNTNNLRDQNVNNKFSNDDDELEGTSENEDNDRYIIKETVNKVNINNKNFKNNLNEGNSPLRQNNNNPKINLNNTEKLDTLLNNIKSKPSDSKNQQNNQSRINLVNNQIQYNTVKNTNTINISPKKNTTEQFSTSKKPMNSIDQDEKGEDISKYDMIFPEIYHGKQARSAKQLKLETSSDGKVLKIFENNKKEVIFPSGVKKEIFSDGYTICFFNNKDIKQTYPDGRIVYFFNESRTVQTTFEDGLQVFKFDNNQLEKHYPDGTKEINFPDGTLKYILCDGYEETFLPDGTLHKIDKDGVITLDYVNGQKDTIYPDGSKVRELPDGTIERYPAEVRKR